ncbi:hypothetical protein HDU77_000521 [Chytriomyces hyalinus]|nr:hypothetical protein HDU77_000521 [Chytriomyces hyalinus]
MSANGFTVYRYYNATDTACNSTLQRIDVRLSQPCTVNTTETNNATLTCTPTSEKADSAHYSTGCVIAANLTSVYATSNDSLVVFSQFADSDVNCSASSLVGGTQYVVDTCVAAHSETGFQTFEGRQIQSEYVSANTSNGQLIRSFFANNNCTNYVSSVLFDSRLTACQSHMSANFSKTPSFKRQVYFSDEACTRPDLITYQLSNKDDCVTKSFCGVAAPFPLQETCVDTPNLPADAAEFFKNRPYAIFDNFLEPNCLGYSHSSAVPMNSCILIEGDQSTSTTFLANGSVQDTTFNGPDCTRGINVTANYNPNGECNGVWRVTAYNYASETSAATAVSLQTSPASPMTGVVESGSGQLSPENNLGAILGGVAGGVVVLAAITAFLCMRYTKKQLGDDKQLNLNPFSHDATTDAQIPFMVSSLAQDSTINQTAHQLQTLQTANPNMQLPPTQVAPVLLPEENDAYRQLQYFSILPLPKPLGDEPM